jgi:hypothetical protein
MTEVLKRTDKLETEMPTMLAEDKIVVAALENLKALQRSKTSRRGCNSLIT